MAAWRGANALAHPFLTDSYKAQSEQEVRNLYIPNAETYVLEVHGQVIGFIALLGNEIGGLFLEPSKHGMGFWTSVGGSRCRHQRSAQSRSVSR